MVLTGLVFLIAFLAGCWLAFARHPIYGLMTYVATYYLSPPLRWWGASLPDLRWSLLAAAVTLAAVLFRKNRLPPKIPLFRHRVMVGLVLFLSWIALQSLWALDVQSHQELLLLMAKYVLLAALIYRCVDSERHLRMFLWAHVAGCAYLGWIAYTTSMGGRFEGFGSPDIDEANSGALVMVTGILVGSSIFLLSKWRGRLVLLAGMPFIVNALILTISRSGFLALSCSGLLYNLFTPRGARARVAFLSVLALLLFILLTNQQYWTRISSIEAAGQHVEGVDTGAGRVDLVQAQWRMFLQHPFGCGHRCTAVLSRQFLPDSELTGVGAQRARSSHSTPMTMLVEHGVLGFLLYLLLVIWLVRSVLALNRLLRDEEGLLPMLLPAIAGLTAGILVGDLFVDYLILEVRVWFIAIVMVMLNMSVALVPVTAAAGPRTGDTKEPALVRGNRNAWQRAADDHR